MALLLRAHSRQGLATSVGGTTCVRLFWPCLVWSLTALLEAAKPASHYGLPSAWQGAHIMFCGVPLPRVPGGASRVPMATVLHRFVSPPRTLESGEHRVAQQRASRSPSSLRRSVAPRPSSLPVPQSLPAHTALRSGPERTARLCVLGLSPEADLCGVPHQGSSCSRALEGAKAEVSRETLIPALRQPGCGALRRPHCPL